MPKNNKIFHIFDQLKAANRCMILLAITKALILLLLVKKSVLIINKWFVATKLTANLKYCDHLSR